MTRNLVPFWRYVVESCGGEEPVNPQDDLTSDLIRMRDGDDKRIDTQRNRQLHDHALGGRARNDDRADQ